MNQTYQTDILERECERLAQELESRGVPTDFDAEHSVRLTYQQITDVLDPLLAQTSHVRRNEKIGCIVKISSSIAARIHQRMGDWRMFDMEKVGRTLNIYNLDCHPNEAQDFLGYEFGIERAGNFGVIFRILNVDNVMESEHVRRFNISFAKTYDADKPREMLLPRPHNDMKSFRIWGKRKQDIDPKAQVLYDYLSFIYGSNNIATTFIYDYMLPYEAANLDFSDQEWQNLAIALMRLDFGASAGYNHDGSFLFIEFETLNELRHKLEVLQEMEIFEVAKSPLDEDFKFKVKIVES